MYGPYVRGSVSSHRNNAGYLNREFYYEGQPVRLPRGWWVAPAVVILSGLAGWIVTIPLG